MNPLQLPLAAWLAGVALLVAVGAASYFLGNHVLHMSAQDLEIMVARQDMQLEELMRRNKALMVERTMAQRRLDVSNQTIEYLREMLQTSETESRQIREELELFRKITSPDLSSELSVHTLKLHAAEEEGHGRYRLVLDQGESEKESEGTYDFVVHGYAEGSVGQFRLSDLPGRPEDQSFSFRHFATIDGAFQLSESFGVERIEVELLPGGEQNDALTKSFNWRQVMADSVP